jgi:hypothetical protein
MRGDIFYPLFLFSMINSLGLRKQVISYIVFALSNSHFYHIMIGVYFLSFPEHSPEQLAWFGIVTMMTSLLLEVPSSYVSDRR